MRYNFKIDPKALYLFIDDMNEEKYNSYLNEFKEFRFKYNDQLEETSTRLFEIMFSESDSLQMLIFGVKDNGEEQVVAYYFVGEEPIGGTDLEMEEYKEAIKCLNDILENYRIV
ncbi:MAG: hypothetical protein J6D47_11885 [Peptostreptococcaceae bacterium]|nr:hypothetical protein [Peptostreptococcaceae bacterium]